MKSTARPFDPLASAVLVLPGVLVTNRHVVANGIRVEVATEGGAVAGEVVPTRYAGGLVLVPCPASKACRCRAARPETGPLYAIGADEAYGVARVNASGRALDGLAAACRASGNGQLLDLAGQALGGAGRYGSSAQLFRDAIAIDTNSVKSTIGLAVTLHRKSSPGRPGVEARGG